MINIILICSKCKEPTYSSDVEDKTGNLTIDFSQNRIEYHCPQCMKFNEICTKEIFKKKATKPFPKIGGSNF